MLTRCAQKVSVCVLAIALLSVTAEAGSSRKLPYPAASNAKDFLPLDQYPVGTDLTSNPKHYVTPSACFPAGAVVHTPSGPLNIESLRLGDKVLTMQPSGKPAFEEVFMFSHQDSKQVSTFATLKTSSGRSISATPGHYLWAQKPGQEAALHRAGDIQVGDELFELDGCLSIARTVVDASISRRVGLFNPHTASGSLVVDGIAASVLTDFMPASLALHTAITMPARALYNILPTPMAELLNTAVLSTVFNLEGTTLRALVSAIKA